MRLGRLGHDPMARPAPVTLGWVPRPNLTPADTAIRAKLIPAPQRIAIPAAPVVRKPQRKTSKVLRPQPGQLSNTQCSIRADWPEVINRLLACPEVQMQQTLARMIGMNRFSLYAIRMRKSLPGEKNGKTLAALYAKHVGGALP